MYDKTTKQQQQLQQQQNSKLYGFAEKYGHVL